MSGLTNRLNLVRKNIFYGASKYAELKKGLSKDELREQLKRAVVNTANMKDEK